MEVLSARMAPAFNGEDSWKYKRVHDNKHVRKAEVKVGHRPERAVGYDGVGMRESVGKSVHSWGVNGWEGVGSQFTASVSRAKLEDLSVPDVTMTKQEMPQESSDDSESSHDVHPDDIENSSDEDPFSLEFAGTPQKWPIIQVVLPPPWLPKGWTAVLRTRESGSKDKYYVDPVSQRRFRSKTEVNYFLQTGKSYRYKRNLALLTKPLKEDPVSLPNSVSSRNVHVDMHSTREAFQTLPFMSPSAGHGCEHQGGVVGQAMSSLSSELRLSMVPSQAELTRKPYNKPGPKPRFKTVMEDPGRSSVVSGPKRSVVDERKSVESFEGQGTEHRGKLILKLKRKSTELDEGGSNGKKPRPFQVIGAAPVMQGKSVSSTSDEEERHHTVEISLTHLVPHSLVPSTHVSRRPMTKAPLPSWQHQPYLAALGRPLHGRSGSVMVSSNGQGHSLDNFGSFVTLLATEPETLKDPPKRESPAEQLQKLGRKLCQHAVNVLCGEFGGCNTLQPVSFGLNTSIGHGMKSVNSNGDPGLQTAAPYLQYQPCKRLR